MNPYKIFVSEYARYAREGRKYPLGEFPFPENVKPPQGAPKALVFAPHPDDETIVGALALRMLRQSKWEIIDVPVTLGSNKARQQERLNELKNCCRYLGFGVKEIAQNGLEKVNCMTRSQSPTVWNEMVNKIVQVLKEEKPRAIFLPHNEDWNSTHIGTHYLVVDALKNMPDDFTCFTVETEYWGAMRNPDVMVEVDEDYVSDILTALTYHVGEVKRNPYHLSLPSWFIDNTRRGAEIVGGQGAAAPDFIFSILYRLRVWEQGKWNKVFEKGIFLPMSSDPEELFITK
ncbi:MAG: PIG-L deacetylase family protein [Verrucomicrobiia bacterium]